MFIYGIVNCYDIVCFSYDMRSKHSDKATHWKDEEYFKERAHFITTIGPASLNIKRIEQRDEGEYICRVDFIGSPTRNSKIHLTIISKYNFSVIIYYYFIFFFFSF